MRILGCHAIWPGHQGNHTLKLICTDRPKQACKAIALCDDPGIAVAYRPLQQRTAAPSVSLFIAKEQA